MLSLRIRTPNIDTQTYYLGELIPSLLEFLSSKSAPHVMTDRFDFGDPDIWAVLPALPHDNFCSYNDACLTVLDLCQRNSRRCENRRLC